MPAASLHDAASAIGPVSCGLKGDVAKKQHPSRTRPDDQEQPSACVRLAQINNCPFATESSFIPYLAVCGLSCTVVVHTACRGRLRRRSLLPCEPFFRFCPPCATPSAARADHPRYAIGRPVAPCISRMSVMHTNPASAKRPSQIAACTYPTASIHALP
jgi:hypothetical protein